MWDFLKMLPCFKDKVATDLENLEIQRKFMELETLSKSQRKLMENSKF